MDVFIIFIIIAISISLVLLLSLIQLIVYKLQRKHFIKWAEEKHILLIHNDLNNAFLVPTILNKEIKYGIKLNGFLKINKFLDIEDSKEKSLEKILEWGRNQCLFLSELNVNHKEKGIERSIIDKYFRNIRGTYETRLFLLTKEGGIYWEGMKGIANGFIKILSLKKTWLKGYYVLKLIILDYKGNRYEKPYLKGEFNILIAESDKKICKRVWKKIYKNL